MKFLKFAGPFAVMASVLCGFALQDSCLAPEKPPEHDTFMELLAKTGMGAPKVGNYRPVAVVVEFKDDETGDVQNVGCIKLDRLSKWSCGPLTQGTSE